MEEILEKISLIRFVEKPCGSEELKESMASGSKSIRQGVEELLKFCQENEYDLEEVDRRAQEAIKKVVIGSMEVMQKIARKCSYTFVKKRISSVTEKKLYPIPLRNYIAKYERDQLVGISELQKLSLQFPKKSLAGVPNVRHALQKKGGKDPGYDFVCETLPHILNLGKGGLEEGLDDETILQEIVKSCRPCCIILSDEMMNSFFLSETSPEEIFTKKLKREITKCQAEHPEARFAALFDHINQVFKAMTDNSTVNMGRCVRERIWDLGQIREALSKIKPLPFKTQYIWSFYEDGQWTDYSASDSSNLEKKQSGKKTKIVLNRTSFTINWKKMEMTGPDGEIRRIRRIGTSCLYNNYKWGYHDWASPIPSTTLYQLTQIQKLCKDRSGYNTNPTTVMNLYSRRMKKIAKATKQDLGNWNQLCSRVSKTLKRLKYEFPKEPRKLAFKKESLVVCQYQQDSTDHYCYATIQKVNPERKTMLLNLDSEVANPKSQTLPFSNIHPLNHCEANGLVLEIPDGWGDKAFTAKDYMRSRKKICVSRTVWGNPDLFKTA